MEEFGSNEKPSTIDDASEDYSAVSPKVEDTDTEDTTSDDEGRPSKQGDDDLGTLKKRLEALEKNRAAQTRSWQQEKQAREEYQRKLDAYEQRMALWQQHGVNPDEIDRLVRQHAGSQAPPSPQVPPQTQMSPEQVAKVIGSHTRQATLIAQWEDLRDSYCDENKDFDSPEWKTWFDTVARLKVQEEINETGQVVTKPRQMLRYVTEKAMAMRGKEAAKAAKEARVTREKINSQGVVDTGSKKRKPGSDDTEEDFTDTEYANLIRNHSNKIRSGAPR